VVYESVGSLFTGLRFFLSTLAKLTQRECSGRIRTRTEGRAPVWGYEFISKAAILQGASAEFVPSLYVECLGPVVSSARVLVHEVLDRGAKAFALGAARCESQVLDRGA
jgi:hypothetical protein